MANKEIHELPIKTDISDTSVIPFDDDLGGGSYQASSITWLDVLTNAIRGFAKLASNNVFTGTNRFNKQVKLVSDGTNPPLLVRDSTDTSTMLEVDPNTGQLMVMGAGASNGEVIIKSPSGSFNPAVRFRSNGSGVNAFTFYSNNGCGVFQSQFSGYWFQVSDLTFGHVSINENNSSVPTQAIFYVNGIIGTTYKGSIPAPILTTTQRNAIAGVLPNGLLIFNSTTNQYEFFNGSGWVAVGGAVSWGGITGTLSSQTDLQTALNTKAETASNIGTIGSGLFKDKTGTTLNFRNIANAGGIGVAINPTDNTIELTNQHTTIQEMNDTFFGTLIANDLIQWDGTEWVNVQPSTLPFVAKPTLTTVQTTNNTPTIVATIPIPNNTSKGIRFRMKGRSTTGLAYESLCYFAVNNVAGTLSLIGTMTQDRKNQFTNSVQNSITFSGANAQINITGQTGLTINWVCYNLEVL